MARKSPHAARNAEIVRRRKLGQGAMQISQEMGISSHVILGVFDSAGLSSAELRAKNPKGQTNSGAGRRGALGAVLATDTGRADAKLRRFSWQEEA